MNFHKDILLIDIESTGLDPSRHDIIQLAAILLDKKTLKQKEAFSAYVKPSRWKNRDPRAMKINGIRFEQLKSAPSLSEAINEFSKLFNPKKVILSHYGGPLDMDILRAAYKKLGKKFPFDHHYFNLWGVFFSYLALHEKLLSSKKFTGFTLDDFVKYFDLKVTNRHDALADCEIEAEILRKVLGHITIKSGRS